MFNYYIVVKKLLNINNILPPFIYIGPNAFFDANFDQILEQ